MKKLDIRTTSTGENIIADLTSHDLSSVQEFEDLYHRAGLSRKTAATNLNSSSSRSHAILTLRVETTEVAEGKSKCRIGSGRNAGGWMAAGTSRLNRADDFGWIDGI
jgi:hypothetical protein